MFSIYIYKPNSLEDNKKIDYIDIVFINIYYLKQMINQQDSTSFDDSRL